MSKPVDSTVPRIGDVPPIPSSPPALNGSSVEKVEGAFQTALERESLRSSSSSIAKEDIPLDPSSDEEVNLSKWRFTRSPSPTISSRATIRKRGGLLGASRTADSSSTDEQEMGKEKKSELSERNTRSRRSSRQEPSVFHKPFPGIVRASRSDSSVERRAPDLSIGNRSSVDVHPSSERLHRTLGYLESEDTRGHTPDLTEWLGLELPPSFYINGSLTPFMSEITELRKKIKDKEILLSTSVNLLKELRKFILWKDAKKWLKTRKTLCTSMKRFLSRGNREFLLLCRKCTHVQDLPLDNTLHSKLISKIVGERKDWNEISPLLEELLRSLACKSAKEKKEEFLDKELTTIKSCLLCEDLGQAFASLKEDMIKIPSEISILSSQEKEIQERLKKNFITSHIQMEAIKCLTENVFPTPSEFVHSEAVFVEMARQVLALRKEGTPNDAEAIDEGSGGVYLIYNNPPSIEGRAPIFVFKPYVEAPGMEGNLKGFTPDVMGVVGNRSLRQGNRLAFPITEGLFREYALGILGYLPRCSLATLRLKEFEKLKCGLLMEFVPHICTLQELVDAVQVEWQETNIAGIEVQIARIQKLELDLRAAHLETLKQGAIAARDNFKIKNTKTEEFQKAIKLCARGEGADTLSKIAIWDHIAPFSIKKLVEYSLKIPDFDRNGENIFLVLSSIADPTSREFPYKLVWFDGDQTFPDTWQGLNPPAWLGCAACDFILKQSKSLKRAIQKFDAYELLATMKSLGIRLQEKEEEIFDVAQDQPLVVGGDLFNILHAFHTVAKLGLANSNTANQVGNILFGRSGKAFSRLHEIFLKAKKLAEEENYFALDNHEYKAIKETELYNECFSKIKPMQLEKRQFWLIFESLVVQELNREDAKKSPKIMEKPV